MAAGQKEWGYLNYQGSHMLELKSKRILELNSITSKVTLVTDGTDESVVRIGKRFVSVPAVIASSFCFFFFVSFL